MKKQKGITLVALIITIIVMVILAGVAVMMSASENGVISQAENAKQEQLYATAKEKVQMQLEYKLDGTVDLNKTLSKIQEMKLDEIDYDNVKLESNVLTIPFKNGKKVEIDGTSDEGVKDKYSFKLKDLKNLAPVNHTGGFYIEVEKMWEFIGEDLSQNEEYYTASGNKKTYKLKSEDERVIIMGEEGAPTNEGELITLLENAINTKEEMFLINNAEESWDRFYINFTFLMIDGEWVVFMDGDMDGTQQQITSGDKTVTVNFNSMNIIDFLEQYGELELKFAKVN